MKRKIPLFAAVGIASLIGVICFVGGLLVGTPHGGPDIGSQVMVAVDNNGTSNPLYGTLRVANAEWVCVEYEHAPVWYRADAILSIVASGT